jgi:predicted AAA+ superfamily ATPase
MGKLSRTLKKELLLAAKEFPAVTIFGPRQSGKTTLAQITFPKKPYVSFENPDVRNIALGDPRAFLSQYENGAILDEIQKAPELLSYLQEILDKSSKNGKFILTGSHQPELHGAIAQSLAGRTAVLELYPFSLEEALNVSRVSKNAWELIFRGFFPRLLCQRIRVESFYRSYVATYLERDLQSIVQISDKPRFEKFLILLASRIGQLIDYSSLSNDVGVSLNTIKNWINALKSLYLLFELLPWHSNIRRRLVKTPKLYFTDTGLAVYLMGIRDRQTLQNHPLRGLIFENFVLMDLVKYEWNRGSKPSLYFFRDSIGNEVDILWERNGFYTPIEIKSAETFNSDFVKGIFTLQKTLSGTPHEKQLLPGIVICNAGQTFFFKGVNVCNLLANGGRWSSYITPTPTFNLVSLGPSSPRATPKLKLKGTE